MSIIIGSARIDENGNITGGSAGDQTGKEVSTQEFYVHSKGWYVLRPKDESVANAIATAMSQACANDKIGYDQNNRGGVITNVKKYGTMAEIDTKTEADCSSLVRGCIWQATGKDVGDFYTGNEADVLEDSGLFESKKSVSSSDEVYNGDVLVTKSKGHTVVVISGRPRTTTSTTSTTSSNTSKTVTATKSASKGPDSSLAGTYKATTAVNMRNGAGTSNSVMVVLPSGTTCRNYGYYSVSSGTKWLYVQTTIKGVTYTGFVSSKYLKK